MKWTKLGRIYVPDGTLWWAKTHCYVPTPYLMKDRIRIFLSFWDDNKIGRIGFVDVDPEDPRKLLKISDKPVLDIGIRGTFDDNGVTPTSIVKKGNDIYLYYFGWQLGVKVRYYMFAGLAMSNNNGETFQRIQQVPILDRKDDELFVRSAPFVLYDANEDKFKMWYVSGNKWIKVNKKEIPSYNLRYIESNDGIHWNGNGIVCLDLSSDDEIGFGRPFVIKENNQYKMWYSIRTKSKGYRIGYAESKDGKNWIRKDDEVGIDVSETGWDSEMICFPSIIEVRGKKYMFYNGNNFGETGFGAAELTSE